MDDAFRKAWANMDPELKLVLQNFAGYESINDFLSDSIAMERTRREIEDIPTAPGPIGS